jgi:hypothetical protein
MWGNFLIAFFCAQASRGVQSAIRLLERRCHSVYHAIVCYPSLRLVITPCVPKASTDIVYPSGFVLKWIPPLWLWTCELYYFRLAQSHSRITQPRKFSVLAIVSSHGGQAQSPNRRVQANIPTLSLGWFIRWSVTCSPALLEVWHSLGLAKLLVDSLLVHNHLLRATAISALQSRWINSELEELEALYERRINVTLGDTT